MFSALIVHARPEPGLTLTLSRLVEAALAGLLADVAIVDFCGDPLAARLAEEGGCALKRPDGDPTQALSRAVGEARAAWTLVAASGLAPAPGWAQAARETLSLAAAQGTSREALAGAVFVAPRRGWAGLARPADGVVLARREALARSPLSPSRPGPDALAAARRIGRVRRIKGLCDDERG